MRGPVELVQAMKNYEITLNEHALFAKLDDGVEPDVLKLARDASWKLLKRSPIDFDPNEPESAEVNSVAAFTRMAEEQLEEAFDELAPKLAKRFTHHLKELLASEGAKLRAAWGFGFEGNHDTIFWVALEPAKPTKQTTSARKPRTKATTARS